MDSHGYRTYYAPAVENLFENTLVYPTSYEDACRKLDKVIGYPIFFEWMGRGSSADTPLTYNEIALLQKLAGPYGKTFYRMLCIQKGLEP